MDKREQITEMQKEALTELLKHYETMIEKANGYEALDDASHRNVSIPTIRENIEKISQILKQAEVIPYNDQQINPGTLAEIKINNNGKSTTKVYPVTDVLLQLFYSNKVLPMEISTSSDIGKSILYKKAGYTGIIKILDKNSAVTILDILSKDEAYSYFKSYIAALTDDINKTEGEQRSYQKTNR